MYRVLFAVLWCTFFLPPPVYAAITSTTASIGTHTMTKSASIQTSITVQNTDAQTIRYIKILRPSNSLSITGASSGWAMSWDSDYVILTGGSLTSGNSIGITLDITSGSVDMASTSWSVQVSDAADGSSLFSATGDLSFTISGDPPDSTSPIIANVSLATTNSSFTVVWTTDEAANGVISYGTTNSYGSTKNSASFTRNHSLTATALAQDTTYYFRIDSADASGNTANSYESFLVTSDVQPTATPTVTPTPTSVPGATPTPTPLPDKTEPLLIVHDIFQSAYKNPPVVKVTVKDESGIEAVSYAVNGGAYTRIPGIGSSSAKPLDFTFIPKHATTSGRYTLKVKATDRVGNVAISGPARYVLDSEGPSILLSTTFAPVMNKAPKLVGTVIDASGVASIEYSHDRQKTWKSLASIVTDRGIEFTTDLPDADREGTFDLILRATDGVGNTSSTKEYRYAIDRIAPRAGVVVVKTGSILLTPDDSMRMSGFTSHSYTIYIPTTGGVMRGMLIVKTTDGEELRIPLSPSFRSGLWEAEFLPKSALDYLLSVELNDDVRQEVIIPLFTFQLEAPSCVTDRNMSTISDTTVSIFSYDSLQQSYLPWKASAFGEANPIQSSCYSWVLPKGMYRLKAQAPGYKTTDTSAFIVSQSAFISEAIQLTKSSCYAILWFSFCLPGHNQVEVHPEGAMSTTSPEKDTMLISIPQSLSTLRELIRDKEVDIVLMNTWLPDSMGMVTQLAAASKESNMPVIIVMPYESDSYLQSWKQEAQLTIPIVSDPNGELIESVSRHIGPLVVHVSRDGFIQSLKVHLVQKGVQ